MDSIELNASQFNALIDVIETSITVNAIGFIAVALFVGFLCRDKDL